MLNFRKLVKSFGYAFNGLFYSLKYNQNIKIHILIAIIVLIAGFFLRLSRLDFFDICILIILVIAAEMINTSIEEVINLLVNERRLEAKIAKDVSAGMVLLIAILAAIIGIFIFLPHLLTFLHG
jgi:diacylglycerol kinase